MRPPENRIGFNGLRGHIREHYSKFYSGRLRPGLPVKCGRDLAREMGYPVDLLGFIPEDLWCGFLPCGNPLPHLRPIPGERILNLGCGAGIDSIAARLLHGPGVQIVSIDIVPEILLKAAHLAGRHFPEALDWICADGRALPFRHEAFDWIVLNGVFNLFPDKEVLLNELKRVMKPGARLICADLCALAPLPHYFHEEPDAWAWCMSGALTKKEMEALARGKNLEIISLRIRDKESMFGQMLFVCRKSEGNGRESEDANRSSNI